MLERQSESEKKDGTERKWGRTNSPFFTVIMFDVLNSQAAGRNSAVAETMNVKCFSSLKEGLN